MRRPTPVSKTLGAAIAGSLLLALGALGTTGALPFQFAASTDQAEDAAGDHGKPDDAGVGVAGLTTADEVEAQGDGPDENASDTARAVHEARAMALALGDDAPPCAVGMYVSTAARGGDVPEDVPDPMPCEHDGQDGVTAQDEGDEPEATEVESEDEGTEDEGDDGSDAPEDVPDGEDEGSEPPVDADSKGDVDGDGTPGRSPAEPSGS